MAKRSGTADLPLHRGRVPAWLAERMADLAGAITEAIVEDSGPDTFLTRLSDPAWFQAFGAVLGMDWHSSGITTSVVGALKRGLSGKERALGIHLCGGRGKHSRKTPKELLDVADRTGLDGQALVRTSKLVAKVDNAAVADGYNLYLHGFVVTDSGKWVVIQQGMRPETKTARRYHWRSDRVSSFVDEPHEGIVGQSEGTILNLTDHRAEPARRSMVELTENPGFVITELETMRHLSMPARHDIRLSDVFVKRLAAVLATAAEAGASDLESILLTPGMGPRSIEALALVAEVVYAAPSRFSDPARFAFAHGGKDGHPHPVLTSVYDQTIATLRSALHAARIGRTDKIAAFKRLEREIRHQETLLEIGAESTPQGDDPVVAASMRGWRDAPAMGGMTLFGPTGQSTMPASSKPHQAARNTKRSRSHRTKTKHPAPGRNQTDRPVQLGLPGMDNVGPKRSGPKRI